MSAYSNPKKTYLVALRLFSDRRLSDCRYPKLTSTTDVVLGRLKIRHDYVGKLVGQVNG